MLCEKLGYPSPRWLLPLLTPNERTHWHAYYALVAEETRKARQGKNGSDPTPEEEPVLSMRDMIQHFRALEQNGYNVRVEEAGHAG